MIKVGAAAILQDTARVQLECQLVCLNCHGHRASLESRLQRISALANALVASDTTPRDRSGVGGLARAITGCVWVGRLGCHIGGACVVEGELHAATVAASVLSGAVDKLLLGHGGQAAGGNLPCALHASGGGE